MAAETDQHRSEWLGVGAAIFTGGVVIAAEWVFAVAASAPANGLHVLSWVLVFPGILILAGFYVMIAAHTDWLPLFGRTRVRNAIERRRRAELYLSQFNNIGQWYSQPHAGISREEVAMWYNNLREYTLAAWGIAEHASLVAIQGYVNAVGLAAATNERVVQLSARCSLLPVMDDFLWEPAPPWRQYLDANEVLHPPGGVTPPPVPGAHRL